MESKPIEVYTGKYKGVPYEIRKWHGGYSTIWNYYLYFIEEQMPDDFGAIWLKGKRMVLDGRKTRHTHYKYEETWIGDLEWHCGCTYYEKSSGFDGAPRSVKAGCDYNHIWDEGRSYSIDQIERDVAECIDSLLRRVKVLLWCQYCGDYSETVNEKNWCPKCATQKASTT